METRSKSSGQESQPHQHGQGEPEAPPAKSGEGAHSALAAMKRRMQPDPVDQAPADGGTQH